MIKAGVAAILFAVSALAAAQDVTPAIDPGLAGTAANRESLEVDAARAHRSGRTATLRGHRADRSAPTRTRIERRAMRRAHRRATRGW